MEQQPFYIGQKVVSLINGVDVTKGHVYTVKCMLYCCRWNVILEEMDRPDDVICLDCFKNERFLFIEARCFAPIEENRQPRVSAIPELLKAPVEETLDMIKTKEVV